MSSPASTEVISANQSIARAEAVCDRIGLKVAISAIESLNAVFSSINWGIWVGETQEGQRYFGTVVAGAVVTRKVAEKGPFSRVAESPIQIRLWSTSPCGKYLAYADNSSSIRIWAMDGMPPVPIEKQPTGEGEPAAICWGPLSRWVWPNTFGIAVKPNEGKIALWALDGGATDPKLALSFCRGGFEDEGRLVAPWRRTLRYVLFGERPVLPGVFNGDLKRVGGWFVQGPSRSWSWSKPLWSRFIRLADGGVMQEPSRVVFRTSTRYEQLGSFDVGGRVYVWAASLDDLLVLKLRRDNSAREIT